MEELLSSKSELKMKINNTHQCTGVEMPDTNVEVGIKKQPMQPSQGELVELQFGQKL